MATTPGWNKGTGTTSSIEWKYYDTDGTTLLFSLKGIKDPTAEGNENLISISNGVVTITNAAFYDTRVCW